MRNIWTILVLALGGLLAMPHAQAQTHTRTDTIAYEDNLTLWVIGQTKSSTNVNTGLVEFKTDYDPATALPIRNYSFGKLQQTIGYWADGTLATVTDGRGYTTQLNWWKRGIPQGISFPDGTSKSATVNDNGWVTSVTDENGYATGYGYDAMGRLASIVHPTGDSTTWNTRYADFRALTAADWMPPGVSAGQWRQQTWQGGYRKITYFDSFWRPVLQHEYDDANVGGTLRSTSQAYDVQGQLAFQSYPSSALIPSAAGTRTSYDALGRVTRVEQDSELGVLATTTEYQAGFKTRTTNPRGQVTTASYMAYDQPTTDWPVAISHPEGTYTDIVRDAFGKPRMLVRRNGDWSQAITRSYVYDDHQQLCKTIEPETGATVMDYDAAGNLQWGTAGLGLTSTTSCDTVAGRDSGRKVTRNYDQRNRLTALVFPDGKGNQTWSYTPDGLPSQIITYNEPGNTGQVNNVYTYNKRRMLEGESLGQPGWYAWGIGYGYTANGSLASTAYPTNLVVSYAPNALGQATAVTDSAGRTHASGVSYYPNGAIQQFTYGNGIVHTMSQNARQLPYRVTDAGATDFTYAFDANANPVTIRDVNAIFGAYSGNRDLQYDGLDRLTQAHLHYQQIDDFTYDALDNIRSKSHYNGSTTTAHNYWYDPQSNRLTNVVDASTNATIIGLGYDPQGNLANKNGQTYAFDYGNRLRSVDGNRWYRYDGHGRRVINWPVTGAHGDLSQYSQGGKLIHVGDWTDGYSAGGVSRDHLYLGGSLLSIVEYRHSDWQQEVKYQHTDALGSPTALTNQAGTVIDRTQWEPYGAAIGKPTYDGAGYTGHVMDGTTGLTYMQQRYYDPGIGRFLSVDPVTANGNTGGNFNRYWYANNNPYRFKDPDGRICASANGKDSCTFDGFKDSKGNSVTREQALAGGSKLAKLFGTDRGGRILRAEAGMTAKYTAARSLAAKGGEVAIKGNTKLGIPDQTVSGSAIVGRMETTQTIANDSSKPGNPDSLASTQVVLNTGYVPNTPINFWKDGSGSSTANTFGHEILHTLYSGSALSNGGWTNGSFNLDHQTPFNEASNAIH